MSDKAPTTHEIRVACEDGSLTHDMVVAVAKNRDACKRALEEVIQAQGEQFKLREQAEAEVERLRIICFQAWWGFKVLRGQRPESPDWAEAQRKAMGELDRLIELTKGAGAPKKEFF